LVHTVKISTWSFIKGIIKTNIYGRIYIKKDYVTNISWIPEFTQYTIKPVYNGHRQEHGKMPFNLHTGKIPYHTGNY